MTEAVQPPGPPSEPTHAPRRLVVGISGASAPVYGIRALHLLSQVKDLETHLVCSRAAETTIALVLQRLDLAHTGGHR